MLRLRLPQSDRDDGDAGRQTLCAAWMSGSRRSGFPADLPVFDDEVTGSAVPRSPDGAKAGSTPAQPNISGGESPLSAEQDDAGRGGATGRKTGGSLRFLLLLESRDLCKQGFEALQGRSALPAGEDALGEFRAQLGDVGVDVEEIGHGEPPLSR